MAVVAIAVLISGCSSDGTQSDSTPTTIARLVDASSARPTTTASATSTTPAANLPLASSAAVLPPVAPVVPTTTVAINPPAPIPTVPQSSVNYGSCADAKAAGAAPIYQGEPGYSAKLDRDKDGIACDK